MQLLAVLDRAITLAPTYNYTSPLASGLPIYGVLAPFCNTPGGSHAFTASKVNAIFHEIFDEWTKFLVSPASCDVLVSTDGRWFSPDALQVQDDRLGWLLPGRGCAISTSPTWASSPGTTSLADVSEGVRPTFAPDNLEFINTPCEAITRRVATNVRATDEFWLKEMPYPLNHILNFDPLMSELVGGTIFQAILSSLDYHRWHSPVDGRVVKTCVVPCTYYAARLDDDPDPEVIPRSQAFTTAIYACTHL